MNTHPKYSHWDHFLNLNRRPAVRQQIPIRWEADTQFDLVVLHSIKVGFTPQVGYRIRVTNNDLTKLKSLRLIIKQEYVGEAESMSIADSPTDFLQMTPAAQSKNREVQFWAPTYLSKGNPNFRTK